MGKGEANINLIVVKVVGTFSRQNHEYKEDIF